MLREKTNQFTGGIWRFESVVEFISRLSVPFQTHFLAKTLFALIFQDIFGKIDDTIKIHL
jgi:hypothetical protein